MIPTAWPGLRVFAQDAGDVHPYSSSNARLFRGEDAFSADVTGWRRWNKPSPEPYLDEPFHALVIREIERQAGMIAGLVYRVADAIRETTDTPPLLVALLRAGVPVAALLAQQLAHVFQADVPIAALSLFCGLGWDTAALAATLETFPGRPVWFVDGWTGRGHVAHELHESYRRWLADGYADFTRGLQPQLAVLCDPGGFASVSATRNDVFIPSACFTAPEVLGFSRGFVTEETGMFHVYRYPAWLTQPAYHAAWLSIGATPAPQTHVESPRPLGEKERRQKNIQQAPATYRLYVNEVVRALINREPLQILFRDDEATVAENLAPVVYLCQIRNMPVRYCQTDLDAWGCLAVARMGG
jgi:hypothetical protein